TFLCRVFFLCCPNARIRDTHCGPKYGACLQDWRTDIPGQCSTLQTAKKVSNGTVRGHRSWNPCTTAGSAGTPAPAKSARSAGSGTHWENEGAPCTRSG